MAGRHDGDPPGAAREGTAADAGEREELREPFSFRRWSQRKRETARQQGNAEPVAVPAAPVGPAPAAVEDSGPLPGGSSAVIAGGPAVESEAGGPSDQPDLPSIESLGFESDFSVFVQPRVDEALKRAALKKLFSDPHFNRMDGLDVYIDDYGKFEPLPPGMLAELRHARELFNPTQTAVNAEGHAVVAEQAEPEAAASADDVPAEPSAAADGPIAVDRTLAASAAADRVAIGGETATDAPGDSARAPGQAESAEPSDPPSR